MTDPLGGVRDHYPATPRLGVLTAVFEAARINI